MAGIDGIDWLVDVGINQYNNDNDQNKVWETPTVTPAIAINSYIGPHYYLLMALYDVRRIQKASPILQIHDR